MRGALSVSSHQPTSVSCAIWCRQFHWRDADRGEQQAAEANASCRRQLPGRRSRVTGHVVWNAGLHG